jgi:hypothetical protein
MVEILMKLLGKDLEGSGRGLIKVLSWRLPGGTEENHVNLEPGYEVRKFQTQVYNAADIPTSSVKITTFLSDYRRVWIGNRIYLILTDRNYK